MSSPCCTLSGFSSWTRPMMKLSEQVEKARWAKRQKFKPWWWRHNRQKRETVPWSLPRQHYLKICITRINTKILILLSLSQAKAQEYELLSDPLSGSHEEEEQISQALFHIHKTAGCGSAGCKERLCRSSSQPPLFLWHRHWAKCLLIVPRKTAWCFYIPIYSSVSCWQLSKGVFYRNTKPGDFLLWPLFMRRWTRMTSCADSQVDILFKMFFVLFSLTNFGNEWSQYAQSTSMSAQTSTLAHAQCCNNVLTWLSE